MATNTEDVEVKEVAVVAVVVVVVVVVVGVVVVVQLVEGRQGVGVVLPHCGDPSRRRLLRLEQNLRVHVDGRLGIVDVYPGRVILVSNSQTQFETAEHNLCFHLMRCLEFLSQ